MSRLTICAALVLLTRCPVTLYADVVYDLAMHNAGFYFQDFNGLPTSPSAANMAGYFSDLANGTQLPVTGALTFDAAKVGGSSTLGSILANDGRLATAGLISLGFGDADAGPTPSTDRALGAFASDLRTMAFGFDLENAYADGELQSITVGFWQETWRTPATTTNTFAAAWGTSDSAGVTGSNYLTAAGMSLVSQLSLVQAVSGAARAVDGNSAPFRVKRTFTFDNLNLAVGEHFYLRWQDVNESGANASIGIDDLTLTFTHSSSQAAAVPELSSFANLAVGAGFVACLCWRRLLR